MADCAASAQRGDEAVPPGGTYKKMKLVVGDGTKYFSCLVHEKAINYISDTENARQVGSTLSKSGILAHSLYPDSGYEPVRIWLKDGCENAVHVTLPVPPIAYDCSSTGDDQAFCNDDVKSPPKKRCDKKFTPKKTMSPSPRVGNSVSRSLAFGNNCPMSKKVKIINLPEDFQEIILTYELNKILHQAQPEVYCMTGSPNFCKVFSKSGTEAIVEFVSTEAAQIISNEGVLPFFNQLLYIESVQEKTSNRVSITGLPDDFVEVILEYELKRQLTKSKPLVYPKGCNIKVVSKSSNEVIVEFESPEAAKDACDTSVEYGVIKLGLHIITIPEEILTPQKVPSKKVKVFCLPNNFSEEIVIHVFNTCLWQADKFPRNVKPAVKVVDKSLDEVIVEFISVDAATIVCDLPGIRYYDELLYIEQLQEEPAKVGKSNSSESVDSAIGSLKSEKNFPHLRELKSDENVNFSHLDNALKRSCHVEISRLPPIVDQEDFEIYFKSELERAYDIQGSESDWFEIKTFNYYPKNRSVVVTFICDDNASFACNNLQLCYKSSYLKMKKIIVEKNSEISIPLSDDKSDNEDFVPLDSPKGLRVFLKLLIRFKGDTPKSGSYDPFYEVLRPIMLRFGVACTVAQMRAKRSSLRNAHRLRERDGKIGHELHKASCVVFGSAQQETLEGTDFLWTPADEEKCLDQEQVSPMEKHIQDMIKFSEAASWTNNAVTALVTACNEKKEEYDKPVRRPSFWRTVSNLLFTKNYVYGPEKCRSKMEELNREYQDYADEAGRTGAQGPLEIIEDPETRKIMALMHELKWGAVTTNPKVVSGAGVRTVYERSEEETEVLKRTGLTRPTILRKQSISSTKDRKSSKDQQRKVALSLLTQCLQQLSK